MYSGNVLLFTNQTKYLFYDLLTDCHPSTNKHRSSNEMQTKKAKHLQCFTLRWLSLISPVPFISLLSELSTHPINFFPPYSSSPSSSLLNSCPLSFSTTFFSLPRDSCLFVFLSIVEEIQLVAERKIKTNSSSCQCTVKRSKSQTLLSKCIRAHTDIRFLIYWFWIIYINARNESNHL